MAIYRLDLKEVPLRFFQSWFCWLERDGLVWTCGRKWWTGRPRKMWWSDVNEDVKKDLIIRELDSQVWNRWGGKWNGAGT